MSTRQRPQGGPGSRIDEAITLARNSLKGIDSGGSTTVALRQCERLAELLNDGFMMSYARMSLEPSISTARCQEIIRKVRDNRDAEASGLFRFLQAFQVGGTPIGEQLKSERVEFALYPKSIPEAETFASSGRKKINYTVLDREFKESVEQAEKIIQLVHNRIYRWLSSVLNRLVLEKVPEKVLEETRIKVDRFLTNRSPSALEKFRVAYEELAGVSAENWTNACTAVRRILFDVADALFPPQSDDLNGRKMGREQYTNRLWAHAQRVIESKSRQAIVSAELVDLGSRIDAIYAQSNKGIHDVVGRDDAERIIARTYFLIADLIPDSS